MQENGSSAEQRIRTWLIGRVAEIMDVDTAAVDTETSFATYGLTSADVVGLSGELEEMLGRKLAETLLYEHPSISLLARALADPESADEAQAPAVLDETPAQVDDPLCVAGMACRFPGGANTPAQFWQNLLDGVDASAEVPAQRWDARSFYDPDPYAPGTAYTTRGAFVDDIAGFDAKFFGISPREALRLDPQQRMLLEVAWSALEDAGIPADRIRGSRTGVFVGMMATSQYANVLTDRGGPAMLDDPYVGLGTSPSVLAGRVSYLLDLRGPSLVLDTACSSSLVALHLAMAAVRNGECDRAIVAGVSAIVHPDMFRQACKMRMLAVDGRCKTFDAAADGFLIGEGCGAVVIERLSTARRHHHQVHAILRGSAVNQDGMSNGLTAPNGAAQVDVIRAAQRRAGVRPDEVDFVEAHGSGTPLGDAIEIGSLTEVFGGAERAAGPLAVGAVKTNVGHLTGAAGMAGLIKTILALGHRVIPPNLHMREPNPSIDWAGAPVRLPHEPTAWPARDTAPIAGVSSFGWSGTNAHIVLAAPPEPQPALDDSAPHQWHVLPLSARTGTALAVSAKALADHLRAQADIAPGALAYTAQFGRSALEHRTAVAFRTIAEAADQLDGVGTKVPAAVARRGEVAAVSFVFPGTGDQFVGMGRGLYDSDATFRAALDACAELAIPHLGTDFRTVLFAQEDADHSDLLSAFGRGGSGVDSPLTSRTDLAHAAVFALDYAAAQMWLGRGIAPSALIGYSLGEYAAACVAGVFALEAVVPLVIRRAQLVAESEPGVMLTVGDSAERLAGYLDSELSLAAVNSPSAFVVAGREAAVARLEAVLAAEEIVCRRVPTSRAMHSHLLRPLRDRFEGMLAEVELKAPALPLISNVTGTWMTAGQALDPGYWVDHMCSTVRFTDGVRTLANEHPGVVLDLGAGQTGSLVRQSLTGHADSAMVLPTLRASAMKEPEPALIARTTGRMWTRGVPVDWRAEGGIVHLPTYPFEHVQYWPDETAGREVERAAAPKAPSSDFGFAVLQPYWEPELPSGGSVAGPHLIFADQLGPSIRLADRMRRVLAPSTRVVTVVPGTAFGKINESTYGIRRDEPGDYARLLDALADDGALPRVVTHLWSVTGPCPDPLAPDRVAEHQRIGFDSVIALGNALGRKVIQGVRLIVVTDFAEIVDGEDQLHPGKATIQGPALTLPQEYPSLAVRTVDLEPSDDDGAEWDLLAMQLLSELRWPGTATSVAYRAAKRCVKRFRPATLPARPLGFRAGGTYAITGGLGKIGLQLATHIVGAQPDVNLVLLGRTGLPADPVAGSPDAERKRIVDELASTGARILVLAANLGDHDALRAAFALAEEQCGPINGVVHAAGLTSPETFATSNKLTPELIAPHFGPKVYGTVALAEALAGHDDLEFVLLMSSMSAILGGLGFTAYSAANAFQDRFVESADLPVPAAWRSACWDTWRSTTASEAVAGVGDSLNRYSMTTAQGLATFDQLLAGAPRRVIVSAGELTSRIAAWVPGRDPFHGVPEMGEQQSARSGDGETADRPHAFAGEAVGVQEYQRRLAALWRTALGVEQVDLYDNFFELGGNSLVGLQLVNSIQKEFGVTVPTLALFEAPTVADMAAYLLPDLPGESPQQAPIVSAPVPVSDGLVRRGGMLVEDIAIIGMAGRFPGANSVDQFWQNVRDGVESISFFSHEELIEAGVPAEVVNQPGYVRARPVLDNIEDFDAEFFGFTPFDARLTDPQQRLFLEVVWESLENAGYAPRSIGKPVGVFGGANISTYLLRRISQDPDIIEMINDYQLVISNDKDSLTTAASYKLNLRGPAVSVQTFCSTGLVAVHLACRSLIGGECDMAVAGGVSVRVPDKVGHLFQEGGMESPDGHIRTFDAKAKGALFGDGASVLVLKRLADALADGDSITAVIKGSAINNDGSQKVGFTAPSIKGQAEVVAKALTVAGVDADTVGYIEAHGTATELGDPIEVAALTRAFGDTERKQYCAIGSVKTNIGHLDRAAGSTGLIKAALAVRDGVIPASLHYESPNPEIDFERSPFYVSTASTPWQPGAGQPRRAGVNSLGMGGTNAHVVVEQPPVQQYSVDDGRPNVLVLSARTKLALDAATKNLRAHLDAHPEQPIADIAYTLQVGRERFEHRRAVVVADRLDALDVLDGARPDRLADNRDRSNNRPIGFLFAGLAGFRADVAADLYAACGVFATTVDTCADLLKPLVGRDIRDVLFDVDDVLAAGSPSNALPHAAAFVVEFALAQQLSAWGLRPQVMLGREIGELVAICLAGMVLLPDALGLVVERARLLDQADADAAPGALDRVARELAEWVARQLSPAEPTVRCVSTVTGTGLAAQDLLDPQYWTRHVQGPVAFETAADEILAEPERILLEVGPAGTIGDLIAERCPVEHRRMIVGTAPAQADPTTGATKLAETLAALWINGVAVDWKAVHDAPRRRIALPTYVFQRQRYWIEERPAGETRDNGISTADVARDPARALATLARRPAEEWFAIPAWRQSAPTPAEPVRVDGTWLLLTDVSVRAMELAESITAAGGSVVTVTPGAEFARAGDGSFTVEPGSTPDQLALLSELVAEGSVPQRILHLWSGTEDGAPADVHTSFHSLLALAKAVAETGLGDVGLDIITTGAFDVTAADRIDPYQAMVTGPLKVIPLEYPAVRVRHIDVGDGDSNADLLLRELCSAGADSQVALRGRRRMTPHFERLVPPTVPAPEQVLSERGVYLITGGLGGVGLAMAHRLAEHVRARLVLVGRTGLPDESTWDDLLADPGTPAELARRILEVRALVGAGAEVLVLPADVSDRADMRKVVDETLARFGRIDGVLHAAGRPGQGLMQFKTDEQIAEVFAAKVAGTDVLRDVLTGIDLDFLLLFSSIAALTGGGPGQIDYCAANAYLDAVAHASADPYRVISINWGDWQWNGWDDALAGLDPGAVEFLRANRARIGIDFDDGWESILRVLALDEPQVSVSTQEMNTLVAVTAALTVATLAGASGRPRGEKHPRPDLGMPLVAPDTDLTRAIAEIWQDALGLSEVGVHDNFFELGGNSLLGVDLVTTMRAQLKLPALPPHVLYEAPTIADLAEFIDDAGSGSVEEVGTGNERGALRREALLNRRRNG
ncbi:SDR family NAD(P)-dependent oxidoreductase [Nocardia sp. NPDC051756]|uniref:SDR family NAD(P)-dependent oxidoreductase n=1 Tax=Nocardia sp. NPDC051756 TaxID=3154751 RepID=UPI0034163A53